MDRRNFLKAGMACSVLAHPLVTPVALAAAPDGSMGEARVVVILLRGGLDGLDALRPFGDPDFAAARPGLIGGPRGAPSRDLELAQGFALHPALAPLYPLWAAGELALAPAVSTPYRRERSHFEGQTILEVGSGGALLESQYREGWLNRLLQGLPGATIDTAFAVGRGPQQVLRGAAPFRQWSPASNLNLSLQTRRLLEDIYHDAPRFNEVVQSALDLSQEAPPEALVQAVLGQSAPAFEEDAPMVMGSMTARAAQEAESTQAVSRFVAARLREETRIASFSLNGWDTHFDQAQELPPLLDKLAQTLTTLRTDLGPLWAQTTVVTLTEFGRTVRENGTGGTDHGTGGLMLLAGGAVRGGRILGDWPGLAETDLFERRDLRPTRDLRSLVAWVLRDAFGVEQSLFETQVFPGLEMGEDPGVLL